MGSVYNKEYYSNYDVGIEKVNYADSRYTKKFLESVAEKIAEDIHPKTVLDAGCAMGHLVAALRDRGVEAYGLDISEYAISMVREDIRPYCFVGSLAERLPEGLPKRFDVVVNIEVLEHLYAEEGRKAVENLCAITDRIIFSSTPSDFKERTHFNVQQREYWARLFAANGFYDDLNYRPLFITPYASCFIRGTDWLRQVEDYERNIRMSESETTEAIGDKERHIQNQNQIIADKERQIQEQNGMISDIECQIQDKNKTIEDKERHIRNQNQIIADKERQIQEQNGMISDIECQIQDKNKTIEDKERHIRNQNQIIADKERQIQEQNGTISGKERHIQNQNQIIAAKDDQLKDQSLLFADKERYIQNQNQIIEEKERLILTQNKIIKDQECQIQERDVLITEAQHLQAQAQQAVDEAQALLILKETECKQEIDRLHVRFKEQAEILEERDGELARYKEHYFSAIAQREELKLQVSEYQAALDSISNATLWKMTKPVRVVLDAIKAHRLTRLISNGFRCLREHGVRYTWARFIEKCRHRMSKTKLIKYISMKKELKSQRASALQQIKISIVVPLYNTPETFLEEMIRSVQEQTYSNWELCMADGSDKEHDYVKNICKKYAHSDKRIRYQKLAENKGISENTNACISMATGDYIGLLDHDDLLHPAALYYVQEAICEKGADFVYTDENTFHETPEDAYCPAYKPDYAPDTLRSYNYICHFTVFKRDLIKKSEQVFRSQFDGSQDYDLVLRLTEKARHIEHIPKILYYWRSHEGSVASDVSVKPYAINTAKMALEEHLERVGLKGQVCDSRIRSTYKINYDIKGYPLISIIIPNKDHVADLKKCIDSIRNKSTYQNWELIIVENNSTEEETFGYYQELRNDKRIQVIYWEGIFNYSAINNYGISVVHGEHILLLNNDIEVISPDWIEQMLMYSQREDVGAVGAMLYYPDDTIQHAGVIIGLGGVAGHSHKYFPRGHCGYMYRLTIAQNLSAVTAACIMIPKRVWDEVKGLDEEFKVAFNDVDLCMRIRKAGYLIVWTPFAELYHYESKSRGIEDTPEKQKRFSDEISLFKSRWSKELAVGDPYYNPNLTLDREDFSLK